MKIIIFSYILKKNCVVHLKARKKGMFWSIKIVDDTQDKNLEG